VDLELGVNGVGQDGPPVSHHSSSTIVTGAFYAQNQHACTLRREGKEKQDNDTMEPLANTKAEKRWRPLRILAGRLSVDPGKGPVLISDQRRVDRKA
jgi:hypothetical protein